MPPGCLRKLPGVRPVAPPDFPPPPPPRRRRASRSRPGPTPSACRVARLAPSPSRLRSEPLMPLKPALAAFHPKGPEPRAMRRVACPFCGHGFDISRKALSVRCPGCTRPLQFEDLALRGRVEGDVSTMGEVELTEPSEMIGRLVCTSPSIRSRPANSPRAPSPSNAARPSEASSPSTLGPRFQPSPAPSPAAPSSPSPGGSAPIASPPSPPSADTAGPFHGFREGQRPA